MVSETGKTLRQTARFMSLGMALVLCTVCGLLAGYYLDKWLGTGPWMLIIFLFFGIGAGFVTLYREMKFYLKNE